MKYLLLLFFSFSSYHVHCQEFTDLNGRFKIICPGTLEEKIDSVQTDLGAIAYHTFFYQNKDDIKESRIYMVSYCDYPEGIIFADSIGFPEEFLVSTMEAAAESMEGEILYDADILLNEHPGKLWRISFQDGNAAIKTKAFLVGNRYYAVQTISFYEDQSSLEGEKFLESFRLF